MNEEGNPVWQKQDVPLLKGVNITFKCSRPLAEGTGNFGNKWYMYVIDVENQPVYQGRGEDKKKIDNYTGEAITFLSEFDKSQIEQALPNADKLYMSKWKVSKDVIELEDGAIRKRYRFELWEEGRPYTSDGSNLNSTSKIKLTSYEQQLLNDAQELIDEGHTISETLFIKASQEPQYKGQISEERAKELYELLKM